MVTPMRGFKKPCGKLEYSSDHNLSHLHQPHLKRRYAVLFEINPLIPSRSERLSTSDHLRKDGRIISMISLGEHLGLPSYRVASPKIVMQEGRFRGRWIPRVTGH